MSQGIITEYRLDPDYFQIGCAYRIKVKTNDFRVGILSNFDNNKVVFKILDKGIIIDFELTLEQLMYRNSYDIYKMIPDYQDGKFGDE